MTTHLMRGARAEGGGPLHQLWGALGLARGDGKDVLRQSLAWIAFGWLPIAVQSLPSKSFKGLSAWGEPLNGFSANARLLVAVPLLFWAEALLNWLCRKSLMQFAAGEFVRQSKDGPLFSIVRRAERVRDSVFAEAIIALLTVFLQAMNWFWAKRVELIPTVHAIPSLSLPMLWYVFVALPLSNFFFWRLIWRWLIWCRLLWGISRLELRPIALHPDRAGGLSHLAEPIFGFAVLLAAFSAVVAGAWADSIIFGTSHLRSFVLEFAGLLLIGEILAFAPLVAFSGTLLRARLRGLHEYTGFALTYTRQFHQRWMEERRDDPLGSPDIQSLADLANAYEVIEGMRVVPFGTRQLLMVGIGIGLPMLPVVTTEIPLQDLVLQASNMLLGGL